MDYILAAMVGALLPFQTPQQVTNFRKSVLTKSIKTDIPNLTLTCNFSATNIALATKSFAAKLIREEPTPPQA